VVSGVVVPKFSMMEAFRWLGVKFVEPYKTSGIGDGEGVGPEPPGDAVLATQARRDEWALWLGRSWNSIKKRRFLTLETIFGSRLNSFPSSFTYLDIIFGDHLPQLYNGRNKVSCNCWSKTSQIYDRIQLKSSPGFWNIGPHVLKALIDANFEVTVLTRSKKPGAYDDSVKVVEVDFTSLKSLTGALKCVDALVSTVAAAAIPVGIRK